MNTLNRYIANQRTYVSEMKKQPLTGFTNQQGEQATWKDISVTFTDSKGTNVSFLFNNQNQTKANKGSTFTKDDRLDEETHSLLFAYMLDVLKEKSTYFYKGSKITSAKQFLSVLDDNVASVSLDEIQVAIHNMVDNTKIATFFTWLHQHKMLPASCTPSIKVANNTVRMKSGDDALESEQSKLPEEKALLALGAIFNDVIPPYPNEDDKDDISTWQALTHATKNQKNSFTCTMAALAMASPNRLAAEQPLLSKQRLHSHTEEIDGKAKTVYYLNWRGSKGFEDYQNHINAEMAESVDRALHYTAMATEPARALARFYNKPSLPLKNILGDFQPSTENMTELKPAMNKPTNLMHIGLLLGFFDETDKCVRVTEKTLGAIEETPGSRRTKFIKPIIELSVFDKIVLKVNCPHTPRLTGVSFTTKNSRDRWTAGRDEMTVAEFQNQVITMNQGRTTGYNKQQSKRVDYENALFAYTEKQLNNKLGSPFLLKSINTLGGIFSDDCKKHKNNLTKTIFERHGFASDFGVTPHQFRHWQDDYLAKKGLPHILITLLSGRKSAEQTLRYIHTTDAQNAYVIGDIFYNEEAEEEVKEKVSNRLQSKVQYDEATDNLNATFVHETGFCTQNLPLSPCTYMTEFETQCTLCSSSCHIAHDSEAIELLKKDLKVQTHNLEQVQGAINFETSSGMQERYETHYKNTSMMKNLIEVLSDKSIKEGSIVRFLTRSNVMRITDLKTKTVTENKLSLPNSKEALQAAIEAKAKPANDSAKNNFLGFLGTI